MRKLQKIRGRKRNHKHQVWEHLEKVKLRPSRLKTNNFVLTDLLSCSSQEEDDQVAQGTVMDYLKSFLLWGSGRSL